MQLKPVWQSLAIRVLWLMFPLVVWGLLAGYGILPEKHLLMDMLISVLIAGGVIQAIFFYTRQLGLYPDYLTISTVYGVETFKWQQMKSVQIETIHRSLTPSTCTLYFTDHEGNYKIYELSDLSLEDAEKAIEYIMAKIPRAEVTTYSPYDDSDLEP